MRGGLQKPSEADFKSVLTGENPIPGIRRRMKRARLAAMQAVRGAVRRAGWRGAPACRVGRFAGNPAICERCISGFRKRGVTGTEDPGHAAVRRCPRVDRHRGADPPADFHASSTVLPHRVRCILRRTVSSTSSSATRYRPVLRGRHGARTPAAAIDAAARPPRAGRGARMRPRRSVPLGAAVHTGEAYVGGTGQSGPSTTSPPSATS